MNIESAININVPLHFENSVISNCSNFLTIIIEYCFPYLMRVNVKF